MSFAAAKIAEAQVRADRIEVQYWSTVRDLVDLAPPLDLEQKTALRASLTVRSFEPPRAIRAA